MEEKPDKKPNIMQRKGIYLLPNLFTTGSLFLGFFAIVSAMNHQFITAAIAIYVAMILDSLDGRVARLINAQSAFGAEYDSLSDMVSFGMAPGLVAYNWCLVNLNNVSLGKIGWLTAFLYVACVALRLAKFNTMLDDDNPLAKRYFFGLPCPAAAAVVASLVWVGQYYHLTGMPITIITAIITIYLALMMVSNVKYRSFKDFDLKSNVRFTAIVVVVVGYIFISFRPAQVLFIITGAYAISGPILSVWRRWRQRSKR